MAPPPPPLAPRRVVHAVAKRAPQVSQMPQAARLAAKSSLVFGVATLGAVVLIHRIIGMLQSKEEKTRDTGGATPVATHQPTTFDESLVAFHSFMLSGT